MTVRRRSAGGQPKFRMLPALLLAASLSLIPLSGRAQLANPTYGWNLGNTLEATWSGAVMPTQIGRAHV